MPTETCLLDIVIYERSMRKVKPTIENYLSESHNEPKLANNILEFLRGRCDRCGHVVSNTKTVNKKNVCFCCYKKFYKKVDVKEKINNAKSSKRYKS